MKVTSKKFIVLFILAGLMLTGCQFKAKRVGGRGFTIEHPKGWKMKKEKFAAFNMLVSESIPSALVFLSPEKNPLTNEAAARIEVVSQDFTDAIFIEDISPRLINELRRKGKRVLNQGDVKIGNELAPWVLYKERNKDIAIIEFYVVSNAKIFFKIRYIAPPDYFNKYRPVFERIKSSFRLKFGFL